MPHIDTVLNDLVAEGDELDDVVSTVDDAAWRTPTPAVGWTVAHQIAHLNWTDTIAALAATDVAEFSRQLKAAVEKGTSPVDEAADEGAALPPAELLAKWRGGRADVVAALRAVPLGERLPWFGPTMSATSMATARIMETWAHGQDVYDALGRTREPTARLRNVAHIGASTVGFAFAVHGKERPEQLFRIELTGPDGELWTWGPEDSANRVTGPALDFCLLVTQRRHRDDLDVTVTGDKATEWLPIAQAFAGPPGTGRTPERVA